MHGRGGGPFREGRARGSSAQQRGGAAGAAATAVQARGCIQCVRGQVRRQCRGPPGRFPCMRHGGKFLPCSRRRVRPIARNGHTQRPPATPTWWPGLWGYCTVLLPFHIPPLSGHRPKPGEVAGWSQAVLGGAHRGGERSADADVLCSGSAVRQTGHCDQCEAHRGQKVAVAAPPWPVHPFYCHWVGVHFVHSRSGGRGLGAGGRGGDIWRFPFSLSVCVHRPLPPWPLQPGCRVGENAVAAIMAGNAARGGGGRRGTRGLVTGPVGPNRGRHPNGRGGRHHARAASRRVRPVTHGHFTPTCARWSFRGLCFSAARPQSGQLSGEEGRVPSWARRPACGRRGGVDWAPPLPQTPGGEPEAAGWDSGRHKSAVAALAPREPGRPPHHTHRPHHAHRHYPLPAWYPLHLFHCPQ